MAFKPPGNAQATVAETEEQLGRGGILTVLNTVARMALSKKVTFEQRPKEAMRA